MSLGCYTVACIEGVLFLELVEGFFLGKKYQK